MLLLTLNNMENILSKNVFVEEVDDGALKAFEENQTAFKNGFVKYQPSEQASRYKSNFNIFGISVGPSKRICQT